MNLSRLATFLRSVLVLTLAVWLIDTAWHPMANAQDASKERIKQLIELQKRGVQLSENESDLISPYVQPPKRKNFTPNYPSGLDYVASYSVNAGNPGGLNTDGDVTTTGWIEIMPPTQSVNSWSPAQAIPFAFDFFGAPVTHFRASQNGLVTFDTTSTLLPNENQNLPTDSLPNNTIAAMWDSFTDAPPTGTNDRIHTKVFGTAPNRQLWIRWFSFEYGSPALSFAYFSVVLEETSNSVYVVDNYSVSSGLGTTTVGVQQNSSNAVQFGDNTIPQSGNGSANTDNDFWAFKLPLADDLAVQGIDLGSFDRKLGSSATISAYLQNVGTNSQSGFGVAYTITDGSNSSAVYTSTLVSGQGVWLNFAQQWTPAAVGNYTITVFTQLGTDADRSNDTVSVFVAIVDSISLPVSENFETGLGLFANRPGNTVDWAFDTLFTSGIQSTRNQYGVNNDNSLELDGYVDLAALNSPILRFNHIAKTEGGFDYGLVEISLDNANWVLLPASLYRGSGTLDAGRFHEDSYTIWGTGTQIPDNTWWQTEVYSLAPYASNTIRVRFRLDSDASIQRYGWLIDDVEITEAPPPKLLITEFVVTPTGGEFVEIYNPTMDAVNLANYYLTDATFSGGGQYYYNIVRDTLYGGGTFGDFHSRFPSGAQIAPGEYQTVALNGNTDFFTAYGVNPTYEIDQAEFAAGGTDSIPNMLEAKPGSIYGADSTNNPGLTNGDEVIVLYNWNGLSDLVGDVDYVLYNSGSPVPNDEAVDKTGVLIDGPDPDMLTSAYLPDVAVLSQISAPNNGSGVSVHRIDLNEGAQITTGGNGVTGSNEMSEDLNNTFTNNSVPSPNAAYQPAAVHDIGVAVLGDGSVAQDASASPLHGSRAGNDQSETSAAVSIATINPPVFDTPNGSLTLNALVTNFGGFVESSYLVGWSIDGSNQTDVSNTNPLAIGATDTIALSWATPTVGMHTARAWTVLAGDVNAANDSSATFSFEVLPPDVFLSEGFNGAFPPTGWTTINRDGGGTTGPWFQGDSAVFPPYEGSGKAADNFNSANGFYIDDYLITPDVAGPAPNPGDVDSLTFWALAAGGGFPDSLEIRVSTSGIDTSNFTTLLEYILVPGLPGGWTRFAYALPAGGANRYVAFRYLHYDGGPSGGSSNYFGIDDVRITRFTFGPPPAESFSDHTTATMTASVTNEGNIGFLNAFPPAGPGNGFQFNAAQRLFEGGLIIATDSGHVASAVRDAAQVFDADFQFLSNIDTTVAGNMTMHSTSYDDALAESPNGILVDQTSVSIDSAGLSSILWMQLDLTNTTGSALTGVTVGGFLDWDVNPATAADRGQVVVDSTNTIPGVNGGNPFTIEVVELHQGVGTDSYVGVVPLSEKDFKGRRVAISSSEIYPPRMTKGDKWLYINTNRATNPNGDGGSAQDHGQFWGHRSFNLAPSATKRVGFALVAGTTLGEMVQAARDAQRQWVIRLGNTIDVTTDIGQPTAEAIPTSFDLGQNYPNPFNPTTIIRYALPEPSSVTLKIYNVLGQQVAELVNDVKDAGFFQTEWNGRNQYGQLVSSGVYFYRMEARGTTDGGVFVSEKKMLMLK